LPQFVPLEYPFATEPDNVKRTPLFDQHVGDASTIINLKGFARAMHYRGHVAEHKATREGVTLCDVSHMGEIDFVGPDALPLVQKVVTNDAGKLAVNQAMYSVMCAQDGSIIDDLVCFRLGENHFRWVVNVTKTEEDYHHILKCALGMDVKVSNISSDTALVALQGPASLEVLQRITKADLSSLQYYRLVQTTIHTEHAEVPVIVSRTGYTGERGYEIMVDRDRAPWVWIALLVAGQPLGIEPHGVAARESLRTEAGYLLNGNDMDSATNPYEVGLGWTVKLDKDFVGKDALVKINAAGVRRKLVGLEVDGPCTIRHGYPLLKNGKEIGRVTSGPLSAALTGRNLGLGYVATEHAGVGTELEIEFHGDRHKAHVARLPFCERKSQGRTPYPHLVTVRSAFLRVSYVGAPRGRQQGGGCGRILGSWPAQSRRHSVVGVAQGGRQGEPGLSRGLGRQLSARGRYPFARERRRNLGRRGDHARSAPNQCISLCTYRNLQGAPVVAEGIRRAHVL
jgi:aminomethyltransferase